MNTECRIYMVQMRKDSTEYGRVGRYGSVTRDRRLTIRSKMFYYYVKPEETVYRYIAGDFNLDLMKVETGASEWWF